MKPQQRKAHVAFARATFCGYKPQPGEMQLKYQSEIPIEVEVFKERSMWKARAVAGRGVYSNTERTSPDQVMRTMEERFTHRVSEWKWVDAHGDETEAATDDPNIRHAIGPEKEQQMFKEIRRTLCGKTVMRRRIEDKTEKINCGNCRELLMNAPKSSSTQPPRPPSRKNVREMPPR